jgi:hypothetical protein
MRAENPEAFADNPDVDSPDITMFESEYVNAFFTLTSSRQSGMGLGPIPLSEILAYCDFFEPEDPELLIHIIQRVDSAYLEEYNKEQERKNPKK